jgi:anti-sigma factor RsiW
MSEHLTSEELSAFLHGRLARHRVLGVVEHLQHCAECSMAARRAEPAARAAAGLASDLAPARAEHPRVESTLTAYVDGTLPQTDMAAVEEHLRLCVRCREDVDDLRATARAMAPRPRRWWVGSAIAAAALLAVVGALLLMRREPSPPAGPQVVRTTTAPRATATPAPPPGTYGRAEWRTAVNEALRTGTLQMPATLAALQLTPDVLRAGSAGETGRFAPVRTIVETTRPQFTWTPAANGTYLVSIFEEETLVAESGVLNESHWKPARDLPRGRVSQREVAVRSGGGTRTIPAPPAPPALFRVLDDAAYADLQRARALHGGDPLLLGVLYARYGLREDAERELRRVPAAQGQRLLQSIARWPH